MLLLIMRRYCKPNKKDLFVILGFFYNSSDNLFPLGNKVKLPFTKNTTHTSKFTTMKVMYDLSRIHLEPSVTPFKKQHPLYHTALLQYKKIILTITMLFKIAISDYLTYI